MQTAVRAEWTELSPPPAVSVFERLASIRFPLIVLVVCYHNESGGRFIARLADSPASALVVDLLANGFGGIRVPTFFLIAGYVFFLNHRPQAGWFSRKIASRVRSVLVPLVLWTALWMLVFGAVRNLPLASAFLSGQTLWSMPLTDWSPERLVKAVFGRGSQLFLYHLWFLRDLFVLVLLSPVIATLIRLSRGWITLPMLLAWLGDVPNHLVAIDALFFFFVGSHLAIAGRSVFGADRLGPGAALLWIGLYATNPAFSIVAYKPWILCGVVVALYLSGWLSRSTRARLVLGSASRYSFFVFVAHEPVLTAVRRLYLGAMAPDTPMALLCAYLVTVAVTVAALMVVFRIAEHQTPRLLHTLTGGRARQ